MPHSKMIPRAATVYNLDDHSQRNWLPAYALTVQIFVTLLVWVRLVSRFSAKGRPGFDDCLIFVAWILGTLLTAACVLSVYECGFNRHIWDIPIGDWWKGGLVAFIIESLFFWSTCFTKISVLMFYRRLVAGTCSRKFKWSIWAAISFVIAYTLAFFLLTFSSCRPFVALWRQYDSDWLAAHPDFSCASNEIATKVSLLAGALSVITDFYSVMLPAALIMRIRVTKNQRYGLFFIFGMGYLVVAAGIARTIYLGRSQAEIYDKPWAAFDIFVASIAECNVAIACACAPSLKVVFGRFFSDMSTKYGSSGISKDSNKIENYYMEKSPFDMGPGNDAISKHGVPTMKRTKSHMMRKMSGDKKETIMIEVEEDGSFKETHEHGLSNLKPVASGLGDGLVSPVEREFFRILYHRESQLSAAKQPPQYSLFSTQNLQNIPDPESFVISPSPSVSSDDTISLVDKRPSIQHNHPPHKFPERVQTKSTKPLTTWPRRPPSLQPPVPEIPPQYQRPLPDLPIDRDASSMLFENTFFDELVVRASAAGSRRTSRQEVRREDIFSFPLM